MKKSSFPYMGLLLGISLLLMVLGGQKLNAEGETTLPLLMLLLMNEFAFIISAVSVFIGVKQIKTGAAQPRLLLVVALSVAVGVVAIVFGMQLWPL